MFAKKNVVAAAALALLAVGAQAQVTLYGTVDASLSRKQTADLTNGTKSTITSVDSGDMSASFVGIKGEEDLGNGLKANFRLEAAFNLDTGDQDQAFFGQNATVGLSGGFGAVNLGRFENVFKTEGGAFNPFGTSSFYSPTFAALLADGSSWSNGVEYISPNLGGLNITVQHSAKEGNAAVAGGYAGGATAAAVNYTAAGLGLSAVYGDVRSTGNPAIDPQPERSRAWLLGASYDFQVAKLYAQYGQNKFDDQVANTEGKLKGFQVGVAVPVTEAGAFLVSYGENKVSDGDFKIRAASLGYTHNISKRTNAYVAYKNQREKDAAFSVTTNSFGVGVRHSF